MGRISKFSFPLPGRRTSESLKPSQQIDPVLHIRQSQEDGVITLGAQRLAESAGLDTSEYLPPPCRPKSKLSFMTISVKDESTEWWSDATSRPVKRRAMSRKPRECASAWTAGDETSDEESAISGRLRGTTSSMSLRSFYDPKSYPLSISQQTSASSSRDMALRKGLPLVARPDFNPARHSIVTPIAAESEEESVQSEEKRFRASLAVPRPAVQVHNPPSQLLSPEYICASPSRLSLVSTQTDTKDHVREESRKMMRLRDLLSPNRLQRSHRSISRSLRTEDPSEPKDAISEYQFLDRCKAARTKEWFDGFDESGDENIHIMSKRFPIIQGAMRSKSHKDGGARLETMTRPTSAPGASQTTQKLEKKARHASPKGQSRSQTASSKGRGFRTIEAANLLQESVLSLSSSEDEFDDTSSMDDEETFEINDVDEVLPSHLAYPSRDTVLSKHTQPRHYSRRCAKPLKPAISAPTDPNPPPSNAASIRRYSGLTIASTVSSCALSEDSEVPAHSLRHEHAYTLGCASLLVDDLVTSKSFFTPTLSHPLSSGAPGMPLTVNPPGTPPQTAITQDLIGAITSSMPACVNVLSREEVVLSRGEWGGDAGYADFEGNARGDEWGFAGR
ncbi:MAG: hypothetical protein M1824_001830 [Vezdaea acicularis]|nr:MAG: hypothetical protein M1824_001830 [Vezdaea acicularis]